MKNQFPKTVSVKKARLLALLLLAVIITGMLSFWWVATRGDQRATDATAGSAAARLPKKPLPALSPEEQSYLKESGAVTMCVDPDWEPYERINDKGEYIGIAADLVALVAERSGVSLKLVPTKSWEESLTASKEGKCRILSFLNKSPERDTWLLFTEPYFSDPNVFITREEHDFISDPASLSGESIALPAGTSLEERIRSTYPNLNIRVVNSEEEALQLVSERKVDMTLRSLAMTAYTIKKRGLFNLKIAGQILDLDNHFRIGVIKSQPLLRDILARGVRSITPQEVQQIVNRHISIKVQTAIDYALMIKIVIGFIMLLLIGFLWNYQLRKINRVLAARETELIELSRKLNEDVANRVRAEEALTSSLSLLNATLESTADGILVTDQNRHISRWNRKFADLWHIPDDLLNTNIKYPVTKHIASQTADPEGYIAGVMELYENPEMSSSDTFLLADGRFFKRFSQPRRIGDVVAGRVWSFGDITEQKRAEEALEESNRKLELLAVTDGLTGIANRRRFDEVLVQEHARHARSGTVLSLIMLDIDHFKSFNDCYGHLKGDDCLRQIGQVLAGCLIRPADLAARYGGEEFACVLPETDLYGAVAIAEKIRRGIQACAIPHKGSDVAEYVTASLGVTSVQCGSSESVVEIIARADELLYKAKSSGRDRVEFIASDQVAAQTPLDIKSSLVQLVWKDSFCCGNPLIDAQHQSLFNISNDLFKAVLSNSPVPEISSVIARLLEEVSRHFADEQQLLESINFPDVVQHVAEHARLIAKGLELSQQFKDSTLSVGDIFQFLVHDVVMVHLLGADREYFPLIGVAPGTDKGLL
ncbi:MAG: diguanylate cyclase [Desulfuromonadaceae bacterium]|nr:diguanylate cyclase [Desulfuromonadaceae bacterium]MDD2848063.1 diguanylate cyclase [Desulfuromonadaceae bacterium]MDD4132096.1 diguanylate cyclase [Desulfuromonadaceae bacterium]